MHGKGKENIEEVVEEQQPEEIPYEQLSKWMTNNQLEFEEYLKKFDVFTAVRIRSQTKKMAQNNSGQQIQKLNDHN